VVETGETAAPADTPAVVADIPDTGVAPVLAEAAETPAVADGIPAETEGETPQGTAVDAAVAEAEMEVFYTFTWGRAPRGQQNARRGGGERPQAKGGKGRPQGQGKGRGKGGPRGDKGGDKAKSFSARPPRKEKPIDPDNPFAAALMGLKDKT